MKEKGGEHKSSREVSTEFMSGGSNMTGEGDIGRKRRD